MSHESAGFSLVEVVVAVGIISFALVAMLGAFPFGLSQEARSRDETRAAHLARTVFTALRTDSPLDEGGAEASLDLAELRAKGAKFDPNDPAVVLYAGFPVGEDPKIGRVQYAWTTYKIKLWFRSPDALVSSGSATLGQPAIAASQVTMVVEPVNKTGRYQFESIVGDCR